MLLNALATAMLMQAGPAAPEAPTHPYATCLWDAVDRLEPSGEPAQVVVDAAFTTCRSLEIRPTPRSRLASLSQEGQEVVLATLREAATEDLILRVTRVRACRNTAGCRVADIER